MSESDKIIPLNIVIGGFIVCLVLSFVVTSIWLAGGPVAADDAARALIVALVGAM